MHAVNEYCTRAIAAKVVKYGDIVLDLGANEGFHTFNLASLVGENGRVHAFEPNPSHWSNLLGQENIRLWPVAVGDSISVENFYLPVENNFNQVASIVDPRDFIGSVDIRILSVPQVTIDSLEELSGQCISFVKMDIERREYCCMKGMEKTLRADGPIIVFENITPEIQVLLERVGYITSSLVYGSSVDILANVLAIPANRMREIRSIALNSNEISQILDSVLA